MMLGIRVMLRRVEADLREQREVIKAKLLDYNPANEDEHVIELNETDYVEDIEFNFPPEGSTVTSSKGKGVPIPARPNIGVPPPMSNVQKTPTINNPKSNRNSITPPHKLPQSFKFKDYMPKAFRVIRGLANIDEGQYMRSVAGDFNYIEFIANSKSGQFFFYSHDGKYMIKTQTKEESKFLRKIMPKYVEHIFAHPNSLLVRFYGMHR